MSPILPHLASLHPAPTPPQAFPTLLSVSTGYAYTHLCLSFRQTYVWWETLECIWRTTIFHSLKFLFLYEPNLIHRKIILPWLTNVCDCDKVTVLGTWKVPGLSTEAFSESQMIFTPSLAPLHHSCVTVGKSLNLSEPKFSSLDNGDHKVSLYGFMRTKWANCKLFSFLLLWWYRKSFKK